MVKNKQVLYLTLYTVSFRNNSNNCDNDHYDDDIDNNKLITWDINIMKYGNRIPNLTHITYTINKLYALGFNKIYVLAQLHMWQNWEGQGDPDTLKLRGGGGGGPNHITH